MNDPYKVKMIQENARKMKEDEYHLPILKGGPKDICLDAGALALLEAYYDDLISEQDITRIRLGL